MTQSLSPVEPLPLHTAPFTYTEAFILPLLATEAPTFVEGFLGIFNRQ